MKNGFTLKIRPNILYNTNQHQGCVSEEMLFWHLKEFLTERLELEWQMFQVISSTYQLEILRTCIIEGLAWLSPVETIKVFSES